MNEMVDVASFIASRTDDTFTYLAGSGWQHVGTAAGDSLWIRGDNGHRRELLFPTEPEKADSARRAGEALEQLSRIENRPIREIVADIVKSQNDILRIRTESAAPSGSAPLEDALALLRASRDMLEAAASTVDRPRPVLGPRKPFAASEFANSAQVSTEPGSFVVALAVPVSNESGVRNSDFAAPGEGVLFDPKIPYARRVNERLMRSVARAVELGESVGLGERDIGEFDAAVELGVSANLLEALVNIGTRDQDGDSIDRRRRTFSIAMRWAFGRRPSAGVPERVGVTRDAILVFEDAATSFRRRQPQPDTEIVGEMVGNMDHDDGGGMAVVRTVIAVSSVERPRRRNVRVELGATDYELALRAHAGRHDVRATGDLQVAGRLQLSNVTRFEILADPEPDDNP